MTFYGNGYDTDGTVVSYNWDFGDGYKSNEKNAKHLYQKEGRMKAILTVTDNNGATGRDTITINAIKNKRPTAFAEAIPNAGLPPLTVNFYGKGIDDDGRIVMYRWRGSVISNSQNTRRTFYAPGIYPVTFTVTDDNGDTDSAIVSVWVWNFRTAIKTFLSNFNG